MPLHERSVDTLYSHVRPKRMLQIFVFWEASRDVKTRVSLVLIKIYM
jgi:hypothetical protein